MAEPVLVVGAGIAGLTAALALARHGFAVRIVERAGALTDVGAGLQLSPNALRVLRELGLLPALRERGVEAKQVELRDAQTGRRLARVPVQGADGTPYLSLLRSDLQAVLLDAARAHDAINLDLASTLTGIRSSAGGIVATVVDPNGRDADHRAPAVIAADGVGSSVAAALGHAAAQPTGQVAYRFMLAPVAAQPGGIVAWLGAACHVVAYPVDAGRRLNVVVATRTENAAARIASLGASSDPLLARIAEHVERATIWPLASVDRSRRPGDPPNLLMIGDAAHAMLPYAAQGAALAIEDGYVAAQRLATSPDAATAWRSFEAERRPRWQAVRRRVGFHRLVYHLPRPLAFGRDAVLALRSPAALGRDLAWLYDWQPPAA